MIHALSAALAEGPGTIGAKAHGLVVAHRLGLPVPPAFVIDTAACRTYLRDGVLPDLALAVRALETSTGRRFGDALTVSVRSGAAVSMPGMMRTVLDVGLTTAEPMRQLESAVGAVFSSWHTPRATTYRELHDVPHDLGTAVVVQAMVFGDRDARSGTGVAFSHDPNTGEHVPYGEVLFRARGEDVVSGTSATQPLGALAECEPVVWTELLDALRRLERRHRDACSVEFTYESGRLWLLQVRSGGVVGRAAARVVVELADAGVLSRREAVLRVPTAHLDDTHPPRLDPTHPVLATGSGACQGVATGRVATTADRAASMAGPVILVRPHTSPLDMHGIAAAAGLVTAAGGPASHAAIVARAMGKPAVVGVAGLTVEEGQARIGGRRLVDGAVVTIDGTEGKVVLGSPRVLPGGPDQYVRRLLDWAGSG